MVLTPLTKLELQDIFDETSMEVIDFYIKKSLFAQPERMPGQQPLPIQVPKEHIEQWVVQAIGASPVGSGSYGVDVVQQGKFGADVKMLSCKIDALGGVSDCDSGETSLAQNFKDTGISLDEMFANKQYKEIVDGWKQILINKLNRVRVEQSVETIYYIFILRATISFHLCGMKVNIENINEMTPSKSTKSSIFIDNFIEDNYGKVKIYKAKKRLELRLRPKYWIDHNLTLNFNLRDITDEVSVRTLIENDKLREYEECLLKRVFENGI